MRRSMKRLKTFKQVRPTEGTSNDPNAIPLEAIGGKSHHSCVFFLTVELDQILKYHLYLFDSCCNIFFSFNLQTFLFPYSRKIACFLFRNVCVVLCTYIGFVNFVLRYRIRLFTKTITIKIIF